MACCAWLNEPVAACLPPGTVMRLPTETEWTDSKPWPYPYRPDDGREDETGPTRAMRGGAFPFHRGASAVCVSGSPPTDLPLAPLRPSSGGCVRSCRLTGAMPGSCPVLGSRTVRARPRRRTGGGVGRRARGLT
jgi:hypothetical protein